MDITFISDTHGLHGRLLLNPGTVLIHAGDVKEYGSEDEVADFLYWFSRQPFANIIFIAGNHDLFLESCTPAKRKKLIPSDIIYLQNSGIEIAGMKVWGSLVMPYFLGMAFNARQGMEIKKVWNKIPADTDILITHGPPKGVLDNGVGDEELLLKVNKIKPAIHCFGHAHGQNGIKTINDTAFINALIVNCLNPLKNEEYRMAGKPIICKI
jgi:Icc-related predicted phosphoesterase